MSGAKSVERAETGPMSAEVGCHLAQAARDLVDQARESFPFTRKCRRITAQANARPSAHGGQVVMSMTKRSD